MICFNSLYVRHRALEFVAVVHFLFVYKTEFDQISSVTSQPSREFKCLHLFEDALRHGSNQNAKKNW